MFTMGWDEHNHFLYMRTHIYTHTQHMQILIHSDALYHGCCLPMYVLVYLMVLDSKDDLTLAICTAQMYLYVYGESIFSGNL